MPNRRDLAAWAAIVAVCLLLYWFAVRPLLQFRSPIEFVVMMALAAAALTVILWLELRRSGAGPDKPSDQGRPE